MAKSKSSKPQIIQGGINITGNVEIKNSKIAGRDNLESVNISISFAPVYDALRKNKTIKSATRKVVEKDIKLIEQEVRKGNKAKASFIQKRVENIKKMVPDIADVVIATLLNPTTGVSLAIKKVIGRFETETK